MSQAKVRTRLYDCEAKLRPASNGTKPCPGIGPSSGPCYATPYEVYHACVGRSKTGPFEHIQHLSQRERLSVHLKIDGSGSMDILQMLKSEDVEKLRTLDITLQLGSGSPNRPLSERIEKDISTLEKFRETGQSQGSFLSFWIPKGSKKEFINQLFFQVLWFRVDWCSLKRNLLRPQEVMQVSGSTLESMAEQWAETVGRWLVQLWRSCYPRVWRRSLKTLIEGIEGIRLSK